MQDPRYTDGSYAAANPGWHIEDAAHKARGVHALLGQLGWAPAHMLDVGCGTGEVLRTLRTLRPEGRYTGWDPFAGEPSPGVTLVRADPWELLPTADLALCLDVLEHLPDPEAAIDGLRRMAPRLILRVPLERSLRDVLRPHHAEEARLRYGHLHRWSGSTLDALLRARGLTPVLVRYDRMPYSPPRLGGWPMELLRRAGERLHPAWTADALGAFSIFIATVSK